MLMNSLTKDEDKPHPHQTSTNVELLVMLQGTGLCATDDHWLQNRRQSGTSLH
jgi:hypothetical protein